MIKVSKISLVDLAGSERAKDTGAEGKRLQVISNGHYIHFNTSTQSLCMNHIAKYLDFFLHFMCM